MCLLWLSSKKVHAWFWWESSSTLPTSGWARENLEWSPHDFFHFPEPPCVPAKAERMRLGYEAQIAQRGWALWLVQAFHMLSMEPLTREKVELKSPLVWTEIKSINLPHEAYTNVIRNDIYSHRLLVILVFCAFSQDPSNSMIHTANNASSGCRG